MSEKQKFPSCTLTIKKGLPSLEQSNNVVDVKIYESYWSGIDPFDSCGKSLGASYSLSSDGKITNIVINPSIKIKL